MACPPKGRVTLARRSVDTRQGSTSLQLSETNLVQNTFSRNGSIWGEYQKNILGPNLFYPKLTRIKYLLNFASLFLANIEDLSFFCDIECQTER